MNAKYAVCTAVIVAAAATVVTLHLRRRSGAPGPVAHTENRFEFTVQAPYKAVFPLFGASAERGWGGEHWNPRFLYPLPERDQQGEVFTVAHGHARSVWVNTAFDVDTGRAQYVYVIPEKQAVLIDVHARPVDPSSTQVKVVYQRTALDPALNEQVLAAGRHDAGSGPEWQSQINRFLQGKQ